MKKTLKKRGIYYFIIILLIVLVSVLITYTMTLRNHNKKYNIASNNVTVDFNTQSDHFISSQNFEFGEKANEPSPPTKKNYVFIEWLYNDGSFDFDEPIEKDITLVAHWERKKVKINFDSNGGSEISHLEINKGDKIEEPNKPRKQGYTFKYWSFDGEKFDFDKELYEGITLKASWDKVVTNNIVVEPTKPNINHSKKDFINYLESRGFNCEEMCSKLKESGGLSFIYQVRFSTNTFRYIMQSETMNASFNYDYSSNISDGRYNSKRYIFNVTTDTVTSEGLIATGGGATFARSSVNTFRNFLSESGVNLEDIIE